MSVTPRYYSFLYKKMNDYEETKDHVCVEKAIKYIKSNPDNPFMLYLPTLMPHCPYHAPKGYHNMYNPKNMSVKPISEKGKPKFYDKIRETRNLDKLNKKHFKNIKAKYLGMISYVDSIYGKLLQALEETGLDKETAIFVFSDHGDWAGDYGLVEKWCSGLNDTLLHIPFIAKVPGGVKGHVVKEQIQHFDIVPTILELAEIEPEHSIMSKSLVSQLNGKNGETNRAVFAEGGYDLPVDKWCICGRKNIHANIINNREHIYYPKIKLQQDEPSLVCRSTMIRSNDYKLNIRTQLENELYDLRQDPQELKNVYNNPEYINVQNKLEKRMLQWYIKTSDAPKWYNYPRGFQI